MENRNMPYNLEAEQSVLGATFYSKEALQKVSDELDREDFYAYFSVNSDNQLNFNQRKEAIELLKKRLGKVDSK